MVGPGPVAGNRRQPVNLKLLPVFAIQVHGADACLPTGARRLVAYAALAGRRLPRSALAPTLWPDLPAQRACATLRSTLWQVRRRAPGALTVDQQNVRLADAVLLDYSAAIAASRAVARNEDVPPAEFEPLRHDLLIDWQDEWVLLERERFRQIRLHALENQCRRMAQAGNTATAIDIGLGAVAVDPLRETAQRALIQAHLADGNVSEAIRVYTEFASLLRHELGVEPSSELAALLPQARSCGRRADARPAAGGAPSARSRGRS